MCGITGFIDRRQRSGDAELARRVGAMADAIRHRGPDAHGVWVDEQSGVALGHRRLSIIDVSDAGAQPMRAPSGRYVVVYNGEIYNFAALRARNGAIIPRSEAGCHITTYRTCRKRCLNLLSAAPSAAGV